MKIDYELLLDKLQANGMDFGRARALVKRVRAAAQNGSFDTREAREALRHGFLPDKIDAFRLSEENYDQYLSDFDYHMMHPLNNHFRIWVNDKLTLKYVLSGTGFSHYMPDYYLYIENDGRYTYLMDLPDEYKGKNDCILRLLSEKKILAMKPNHGEGGAGFIRLEMDGEGTVRANGDIVPEDLLGQFESQLNGYIVTEYIRQCSQFANVWPGSECSLRVIMAKRPTSNKYEPATFDCIASYARFGGSTTGSVSNISQGGIAVPFDFDSGRFWDHGWSEGGGDRTNWNVTKHPDTGVAFKGMEIPRHEEVKDCIFSICQYISSLDYLGFDIMISEESVYVCEINTLPGYDFEQVALGPVMASDPGLSFYKSKKKDYPEGLFLNIIEESMQQ